MNELTEIEAAVKQLPENDVRQLAIWLRNYLDEMWDQQIETDFTLGKLEHLIAQAEIALHQVSDLDEVLCDG